MKKQVTGNEVVQYIAQKGVDILKYTTIEHIK